MLTVAPSTNTVSSKEQQMGYKIINVTPEFREQYTERPGLEGPFFYAGNRVLYYDPSQGQYLNPQTDLYLTYDDYCHFTGEYTTGGFVDVGNMSYEDVRRMGRE
jgi:hypothetical protein